LKSLNNQADFDSAIRRFDPSRPSQLKSLSHALLGGERCSGLNAASRATRNRYPTPLLHLLRRLWSSRQQEPQRSSRRPMFLRSLRYEAKAPRVDGRVRPR
jgi:hypothetical protein